MANLLDNPVYVTEQDVFDTTERDDLQNETSDIINKLIVKAQYVIDGYLNSYGEPFEETQQFIFPIKDEDGNESIPQGIKIATVYIIENLYDSLGKEDNNGKISSESL